MESIKTVAEFTEVLKNNPKQAYDFIAMNYWKLDKSDLAAITKELLFGIYNYYTPDDCYGLLNDVAIELDDQYDEAYQNM